MDSWATTASTDTFDVFRVSAAGILWTAHFSAAAGWTNWSALGGAIFPPNQQVCAVSGGIDLVHAFAVDKTDVVQRFSKSAGSWQGPLPIAGPKPSDVSLAAACSAGGALNVFARVVDDGKTIAGGSGGAGAVARATLGGGTVGWSAWAWVGNPATTVDFSDGSLSALVKPGGQIYMFAELKGEAMYTALPDGPSTVAVWKSAASDINGRPSGVARTATSLDVVALDPFRISTSDLAIAGGAWQGPQFSDQEADSQPAKGVAIGPNLVAVIGYGEVASGSGIIVSRVTIDGMGKASWGVWQLVPGDPSWQGLELCAVLRGGRYLHLFVNHNDGMVTAVCDTAATSWSWSAWTEIKAPTGPHWQLANKLPKLTRSGTVFQRLPNWLRLILGGK